MHATSRVFEDALKAAIAPWRVTIEDCQLDQLRAHFEAMMEANRTTNLTRITDPVEAAVKHYADSLALLPWVRDRRVSVQSVLDVGTGAGFPSVPLAVMRPDWAVTAMDATRKKIDFLQRTATSIGLKNLQCRHAHSSHVKPEPVFGLVVFRALARLPQAVRRSARYVAPSGRLVAYTTASVEPAELATAAELCRRTGVGSHERFGYRLTLRDETLERVLQIFSHS